MAARKRARLPPQSNQANQNKKIYIYRPALKPGLETISYTSSRFFGEEPLSADGEGVKERQWRKTRRSLNWEQHSAQ